MPEGHDTKLSTVLYQVLEISLSTTKKEVYIQKSQAGILWILLQKYNILAELKKIVLVHHATVPTTSIEFC